LLVGLALAAVGQAEAVTLAKDGTAAAVIVTGSSPTEAEQTAVRELADYLGQSTGGTFDVLAESEAPSGSPCVYVGFTDYAEGQGVSPGDMGPEAWLMRTVGADLILTGGRPRGALYAVYRFLEDVVGVHWWNPFEESVPHRPTLDVPSLDRSGKPTFRYRDIYMLYGNDRGRFAARNRLNRDGDAGIQGAYGGELGYGPPYHVHTFYKYAPPEEHFDTHPEWFSLIDGRRQWDRKQLCLTNPELRALVVAKLKAYIEGSRAEAEGRGCPAPLVYDVSQNDWGGMCQCDACQAIARAEGSEAGPLFDFVNAVADAIGEDYPEIYIDTLAYMMNQKAPKTIRPRDNVIVRLCDTRSNFTRPITHPENQAFRDHLLSWAAIAKNLRIWDYAVTYGRYHGLPMPTAHTYPADYQFYAEHRVEGVFTEHEYPVLADMRDFKVWMMMKLLEDPYRDYDALAKTFTDGFYGPAGGRIRDYLERLERAAEAAPSYLSMGASPKQHRYLNLAFVRDAMAVFDEAEAAVAAEPVLLRRVRHARLPLDRAAVVVYPQLVDEWVRAGQEADTMPLDRQAIAERYKDTWYAQIDLRFPEARRLDERAEADHEVRYLLGLRSQVPVAAKFSNLPRQAVFQYTAQDMRNWKDLAKRLPDAEAESGVTSRLELSDEDMERYRLPMPWGLYDVANGKSAGAATIKAEDVPGPGYHWYKMGAFEIGPTYYLYFFWSWVIQIDIDNVLSRDNPNQQFEVWANIKFEGPGFPHGNAEGANAISVERVVLVRAQPVGEPG